MDSNFNGPTVATMNGPIMSSGRNHLVPEDFVPLVQDVVDTHPGLTFLKEAAEFHSRYVHTVLFLYYIPVVLLPPSSRKLFNFLPYEILLNGLGEFTLRVIFYAAGWNHKTV